MQGICNKTIGGKTTTYYKGDGVLWGSVLILFLNGVSYFPPAKKKKNWWHCFNNFWLKVGFNSTYNY